MVDNRNKGKGSPQELNGSRHRKGRAGKTGVGRGRPQGQSPDLANLIENVSDAVICTDLDFRVRAWNRAAEVIYGWKAKEVIGKRVSEVIKVEYPSRDGEEVIREFFAKGFWNGEVIQKRKDGTRLYVLTSVSFLTDDDGNRIGIATINRDVTERKHAEKALRASEVRFENIIENLPMGVHMYQLEADGQLRFIGANPAADRILGVDNSQYVGKTIYEAFPWIGETEVPEKLRHLALYGGLWVNEETRYEDGRIAGVFESYNFQISPNVVVSLFRDITARKQVAEELRESRARLLEAERVGDMGNWDWNVVDNELAWSDQIYRIFGLAPGEFEETYEAFLDTVHPEDREVVTAAVDEALAGQQKYSIDHRIVLPNGEERVVHENAEVTFDASGRPLRMLGTVQDVTERKRAYEELQKSLYGTIDVISRIVEERDPYTSGHQARVAQLARAIALEMGFSEDRTEGVFVAASAHDLGKISIPAEILSKPRFLSETEFDLIKTHPRIGDMILKNVEFPWPVADIVLQHHERMDGSGYPAGLRGNEIIPEARVLSVADVVEAMSSHRPYRPAQGKSEALGEISRCRGTLYDADVVDACLKLFREGGFQFD